MSSGVSTVAGGAKQDTAVDGKGSSPPVTILSSPDGRVQVMVMSGAAVCHLAEGLGLPKGSLRLFAQGRLLRGNEPLPPGPVVAVGLTREAWDARPQPEKKQSEPEPEKQPETEQAAVPEPQRDLPPAGAVAPPVAPPAGQGLRLGLLFRLAVGVVLLGQGTDSTRLGLLCIGAFILYLAQTGRLSAGLLPQGGAGAAQNELSSLFVPLLLSLNPAWRTDRYMGEMEEDVVIPPEAEEEEARQQF